jgi:hypothetical protein
MKRNLFSSFVVLLSAFAAIAAPKESPRIVNIINFIRQLEPRSADGMEEVLYRTTASQVEVLNEYGLKSTFLLQYDALINPRYQVLLQVKPVEGTEIGAWWEITQPHVEAAGLEWRGRYPWDWHADVGFSTGYTQEEREKLVDVYMNKFKEVFGYFPKSVGSWFIDAYTLNYMYEKYGIVSCCICKDQYGTDGYTLWGGYWNQAYYPSRINAYMPAQTEDGQIPVPVFRMLGSDPVYQYDSGLGTIWQQVVTLEPVYAGGDGGGCSQKWVKWFFDMIDRGECLGFNYLQAGQENSFTWDRMKDGLLLQFPMIKEYSDKGRFTVQTLSESGSWFRDRYRVTPATSVVAEDDFKQTAKKSIWYDSRYYRVNVYWDGSDFKFRDIHLFDERMKGNYYENVCTTSNCSFMTLPLVDGFVWSTAENLACMRIMADGEAVSVGAPVVKRRGKNTLVATALCSIGKLRIVMKEGRMKVRIAHPKKTWSLQLFAAPSATLPFKSAEGRTVRAEFNGYEYSLNLSRGSFESSENVLLRMIPKRSAIVLEADAR